MPLVLPYVVVDQNTMRDRAALEPVVADAARTGKKLLVIDAAMIEMTKSPSYESTLRASLALLARIADHVSVGRAVPDLLRREHATGMSARGEIVDDVLTGPLREVLRELASGRDGPHVAHLLAAIPQHQAHARGQYLDAARNKTRVQRFHDVLKEQLKAAQITKPQQIAAVRVELLSSEVWASIIEESAIGSALCTPEAAATLARSPSVLAHSIIASAALALRWLERRGIETAGDELFTNELMDLDYAVIASFCDRLVSRDQGMLDVCELLRQVAERRATAPGDPGAP